MPMSKEDVEIQAEVRRKLKAMEEFYGFSPFVARYLSEQPDIFIPYSELSARILLNPRHLSIREVELAAVSASAALSSEHCLNIHIPQAEKAGATREEILEAVMVGCWMAMTRGQSVALRKLAKLE